MHIIPLLVGLIAGLISSIPIGPAEFWILRVVFQKKEKLITPFVWGIIVGDLLYAHLAFWGYFLYFHKTLPGKWMVFVCSIFLIMLGAINLKSKSDKSNSENILLQHLPKNLWAESFLTGLIICISNPSFILFWLYIADILSGAGLSKSPSTIIFYYLGIILGDWCWYSIFKYIALKGSQYIKSHYWLYAERSVSIALILFGVIGIAKFIKL